MLLRAWLALLCFVAMLSSAVADDWVASKLRGQVLQLIGQEWQPLKRGDVVPDDRVIRTMANGRVEFRRDAEIISLAPQTQIQIHDQSGKRFTTVTQYFGEVAVEAEVRNVQHFEVQTPYLAAVVKGTRFVVRSDKSGSSVEVQRGHVAVQSEVTRSTTVISKGQSAAATLTAELQVSGKGDLPPVVGANGRIVSVDAALDDSEDMARLAKQLKDAAKKASGEEKKALEKAAKEAQKQARDAKKAAEKAKKDSAKAKEQASKEAEKAAKDAGKTAKKAEKQIGKPSDKRDKKEEKPKKEDQPKKQGGAQGGGKK